MIGLCTCLGVPKCHLLTLERDDGEHLVEGRCCERKSDAVVAVLRILILDGRMTLPWLWNNANIET